MKKKNIKVANANKVKGHVTVRYHGNTEADTHKAIQLFCFLNKIIIT